VDGWPRDWPEGLALALRSLPGCENLSDERLDHYAKRLAIAEYWGRYYERPAARDASQAQTDKSLERLHDQCEKLAAIIAELRRPACEALLKEGVNVAALRDLLLEAQEAARCCYGFTDALAMAPGQPSKIRAELVTEQAARIYEELTGKTPTFTTLASGVAGAWPDFLGACFDALCVSASVESQAKALREKTRHE
jgi:hypothetical protein